MSAGSGGSEGRAIPFHCPFCGDEDLRPHGAKHGEWECRSCMRAFGLRFIGLLRPTGTPASQGAPSDEEVAP